MRPGMRGQSGITCNNIQTSRGALVQQWPLPKELTEGAVQTPTPLLKGPWAGSHVATDVVKLHHMRQLGRPPPGRGSLPNEPRPSSDCVVGAEGTTAALLKGLQKGRSRLQPGTLPKGPWRSRILFGMHVPPTECVRNTMRVHLPTPKTA